MSNYKVTLKVLVENTDKETVLNESTLVWPTLDYPSVVSLETAILNGLNLEITKLGMQGIVTKAAVAG